MTVVADDDAIMRGLIAGVLRGRRQGRSAAIQRRKKDDGRSRIKD